MNSQVKSSDVEGGTYDTGMTEGVVVRKPAGAAKKGVVETVPEEPTSEINYYGVGVNKLDTSDVSASGKEKP